MWRGEPAASHLAFALPVLAHRIWLLPLPFFLSFPQGICCFSSAPARLFAPLAFSFFLVRGWRGELHLDLYFGIIEVQDRAFQSVLMEFFPGFSFREDGMADRASGVAAFFSLAGQKDYLQSANRLRISKEICRLLCI
jgi:hypothetical protein